MNAARDASASVPTLGQLLDAAVERLAQAGLPEPRREAELLLSTLFETDRGGLLVRRDDPIDPEGQARADEWVRRRALREPFQHITGVEEFHGLIFKVDGRALIPRPETEGLVDILLELDLPQRAAVADICTGSGCLAITAAVKRRDLDLFALDRSDEALELARCNARLHDVEDRIEFCCADLAMPPESWLGRMDAVISNPPYVREEDWAGLEPEVRDGDPREALVAGPTGLEAYQRLIPAARELLRPDGYLLVELGLGQAEEVRELASEAGFRAGELRPDLQGIPRVLAVSRA